MNKHTPIIICATGLLAMFWTTAAGAASPYFSAVTNLNPVGYWPMHEVEAAAKGNIETNYGSLGLLGTGYYPDWLGVTGPAINHQVTGALTGDSDTAVNFGVYNGNNYTNALIIPRTSPYSTLNPPFSVECWFYSTNASGVGNDVWSQCGLSALNSPIASGTLPVGGIRLFGSGSGFIVYTYGGALGQNNIFGTVSGFPAGSWYHVVITCDATTNISFYVNGSQVSTTRSAAGKYIPDASIPFEVGNGRGNTRANTCSVDELAIYTNVLQVSDISTHYNAGLDPVTYGAYYTNVLANGPVIYLRLDGPAYTAPSAATWPVLTNYGKLGANGVYTPGTFPGAVTGPVNPGSSVSFSGVSGNVPPFSGVSSFADAGFASAYNPVGAKPFTVAAIFRGNPTDGRIQTIVGHSDSSWQIALNTSGRLQCQLGTNGASQIVSAKVYNDGNWHQVVEVYAPAANPALTGTHSLYVDGALDSAVGAVTPNGIGPGSALDVMIGSDPQYTNNPVGVGRQFAGQVCEVALFTNALTASEVGTLFDASGEILPAFINAQPKAGNNNGEIVFSVVAGGTSPLAYQWYSNTSSNYDGATSLTNGGGVLGSTSANLTIIDASAYYFVIVTNDYGSVTSAVASAASSIPLFTSQVPLAYSNMWLYPGLNHTLSVSAVGASPLFVRWYTNGGPVGSPTNAGSSVHTSLTLSNVQSAFANYYCVVSNSFGSSTSFVWSASIVAVPSAYANAVVGLNPLAYWRLDEADDNIGDGNPGAICHDYVGGNNGVYTNVYLGQGGYNPVLDPTDTSALFGAYYAPNSYAGMIGTNIDFATPAGNNAEFSVGVWVEPFALNNGSIVGKGWNGGEEFAFNTSGGHFQFYVRPATAQTAGGTITAVSTTIPQGGWYHLVGVCDEAHAQVLLYVNGVLDGTATITTGPGGGITSSTQSPLTIGARAASETSDNDGYTFQAYAYVNDVAVFPYVLSTNQVSTLYQVGLLGVNTNPANLTVSLSGNQLTLSWPADQIGWRLLAETNSPNVGTATNWFEVSGSTNVNQVVIPIDRALGSVFYRLVYP